MDLETLKKEYAVLAKKYKLPVFEKLNQDFEIDRITIQSDCLVRAVRKVMMEKVVGWLRFFEMVMNPASAPRIFHQYIKNMSVDEKNLIEIIYNSLGEINMKALGLEVEYSEKEEAAMIKFIVERNDELKPKLKKVIKGVIEPNESGVKKERNYFG